MSEIRQDQATKRWVIMATERAKRPQDLAATVSTTEPQPEYSPDCPFCPGTREREQDAAGSARLPRRGRACRFAWLAGAGGA